MPEIEEILESYRPSTEVSFQFLDSAFTVKTNSQELAQKLSDYFSGWEHARSSENPHVIHAIVGQASVDGDRLVDVARRPGKRVKEAYYDVPEGRVVFKKRTGVVVFIRDAERYLVGDLFDNMNQLVNQINEVYVEDFLRRGYVLIHASAVINRRGYGVAFCSDSGIGKSSVAVALLEGGFRFLSNDRVLIKADGDSVHLVGVPKKPRVNPGTILAIPSLHGILSPEELRQYAAMDREELWPLESKHDVEVNDIFGAGKLALSGTLGAVYLLNWERNDMPLDVEAISPDTGLSLLRPNVLNLNPQRRQYGDSQQIETELHDISRLVKWFQIKGGVDIKGLCRLMEQIK
jgi:HprK-related kinase B